MTLDELLASKDYQSAAPDDRMRHIDEWAVQAKQEAPEEADSLDAEIPKLRAREYLTAALPSLNLDKDTASKYRDLYLKAARRPQESHEPDDWKKFDEEYLQKDAELAAMPAEERLKFAQFGEVMDRAGKHYQTAEEAKKGERSSELDYGNGVKIPLKTKTLHDRKLVTVTYPDGTPETFEYALDEPPPNAERLRAFMVQNRPEHLGEWQGDFAPLNNLAAHAGNAAVDMTVAGGQFADVLAGDVDSTIFGGKGKRDAAITMPLFIEKQTGPDGADRWVKRPKPDFLTDLSDEDFKALQSTALDVAKGKSVPSAELDKFYMNPALRGVLDSVSPPAAPSEARAAFGAPGTDLGGSDIATRLMDEQAGEGRVNVPEEWTGATEKERREIGMRLAQMELAKARGARQGSQPFDVDPANLLINQEDKKSLDTSSWGAETLDWLGDKAFNIPTVGQAVGSSLPTLIGGVAAGPVGVAPFAGMMGLSEGNQAYEDILQKNLENGIDADTARIRATGAAAAYAALSTALEQAGGVFETSIFEGTIGKSRVGRLVLGFAPESTEESSQSIAQDLITNAAVPEAARKKALEIIKDSLEAGAGALSFGVIPGAGGAMKPNVEETPLTKASADIIQDPEVPTEAKQAVAESADLDVRAEALKEAGKAAAAKPAPKEAAPAAAEPETEEEAVAATAEQDARAIEPLAFSDEAGDAIFSNGAWTLPDGTPAPNAAQLDALRQQYVKTGDMPEGMQPFTAPEVITAPESGENEANIPESTPQTPDLITAPEAEAPTTPAQTPSETAPEVPAAPDEAQPGEVLEEPQAPGATAEPPATTEPPSPVLTAPLPAKEKKARVARRVSPVQETMRSREFRQNPEIQGDAISQLEHQHGGFFGAPELEVVKEKGKKAKVKVAAHQKGEWDWYRNLLEGDPDVLDLVNRLFEDNAASLDDVTGTDAKLDANELGNKIVEAAVNRVRVAREMLAGKGTGTEEERRMASDEKQRLNFEEATREKKGREQVTTWDLEPGDVLLIDAEKVKVKEFDHETGDALLEDGLKYGRQILPTGEAIWIDKKLEGKPAEQEPKFSAAPKDHPELQFERTLTIDQIVEKLDASSRVPGITPAALAKEVTDLAGKRIPEVAAALGFKATANDIASQLIAENKGAAAQKRTDEATAEQEKRPQMEGEGTSERALTPEEKLEKRKTGDEEAPEGTRPEDFEEEGPQPNPFSQRFSTKPTTEKVITTGATPADVESAKKGLSKLLPNVSTAWTGTRAELEKHLAADAKFRWQWKQAWRATHRISSDAQANEAFEQMLKTGLNGKEGFTFAKRTYLITDQVAVRESDGTPANAVRRVLIHEDAHEGLRHLRDADEKVEEQWGKFRDAIPAEELDALAASKYPTLSDWRTSAAIHDEIADEWFAAKIAEAEKRGQPAAGSLVGRFTAWLKELMQRLAGDGRTITDKALIEFMDAARAARFRDRAETNASGQRFSSTNADGDMPPKRMMETQVNDGEWKAEPMEPLKKPSRYDLMGPEKRKEYEDYQNNPDVPEELKNLSQFLSNQTPNIRLRQSLGIMVDYARATLGSLNGQSPEVSKENTEKAWNIVKAMLTKKTFSKKYRDEFQEMWSPRDSAGRAIHQGDAAAAVLQMEVMDYAVRLAGETGDTSMMSMLYPFANDVILSDYQTMSGAARALQVRSAAVRQTGVWTSLRLTYAAMEEAAVNEAGSKKNLDTLKEAVDTNANAELKDEVEAAIDNKVENSASGDTLAEIVETNTQDDYDPEGYWERVLNIFSGEERADLYAFWQSLSKLDRLIQLEEAISAEAGSQLKASKADDIARYKGDPAKLKQAIEEEKKRLMELLGKLTKDDASSESKEKRRQMTRDPKVKRAVKALSETAQAKKLIERFENRNKRLKRDKPAWRTAFQEQVKTPKGKDEFVKAMIAAGITEQTSNRLFDVAAELNTERAAKKAARPKATSKAKKPKAPRARATKPFKTYEEEAQAIIQRATTEAKAGPSSILSEARKDFMTGKISEDQFREIATQRGVSEDTLETLVDVTINAIEARLAERAANKSAKEATEEERKMEAVLKRYNEKVTGTYTEPTKGTAKPKLTDVRSFISSVARQITGAPIRQQEDPVWKRQTIINAFMERGMPQAAAEQAADKLTGIIDRALKEGQAKAAIKAIKALARGKKIDAKRIGEAIRTRAIDPLNPNPIVAALAKEAGYEALTEAQFKRLAELDNQINTEGPHMAAKAYAQMDAILHKVRPRKRTRDIIAGSWVYSALSSLGVWALNWIHPVYVSLRRFGVDIASIAGDVATLKTKPTEAPAVLAQMVINWGTAMGGFFSEAAFALKNDAYSNKVLEMFQSPHRMHQEMLDAAEDIKNGTPAEKVKGVFKWLATSTDYMRRILASADQSWGGVLQQYIIQNEAMRMLMHKADMSVEAAATILNTAVRDGEGAAAKHLAATGNKTEAKLVGIDEMQKKLKEAIGNQISPEAADELEITARNEPGMEIGNRRAENGGWFDFVNGTLEALKAASTAVLNRIGLQGRMIVGFPSVAANILNRSAYFTPLGIMRALHKMKFASDPEKLYEETMATEGQARMRLIEGIMGTIGFTLLGMLLKKKPEEEGFHMTGDGPENKTVREAWLKAGHKPGHFEWVGSDGQVHASISYTRGGLDSLAIPLTFFGAMDDMRLNGKKGEKKNASFAWSYAETVLHGLANQARFFGMKNLVSSFPTSTKDTSIASNAAYVAAPFIPWSGMLKSMGKLLTGEQDKTSAQSAFLAQLPIVSAFTGNPALNALGDPVGPQSEEPTTKAMERLEYAGFPFFIGVDTQSKNADIYRFMLKKGIAPAAPMRSTLEAANGFITDAQWRRYVKLRGTYLKDAIRAQKDAIQFMNSKDAGNAMEDISRDATKTAKKEMSFK